MKMGSYRAVLEVEKYCGPQDILKHCRQVSSLWAQTGLSNELWDFYSDACGFPPRHPSESAFQAYVRGKTQGYKSTLFVGNEVVIYDCLTGLTERRSGHTAKKLANWVVYLGKIISFGGCIGEMDNIAAIGTVCLYESNNFHQLQSMITPRFRHSGIVFQGKLYTFGGLDGKTSLVAAEVLNLKQWDTIAEEKWQSLPNALTHVFDVSLSFDLKYIYICGNWAENVEQFCPQTNTYINVIVSSPIPNAGIVYGTELLILSQHNVLRADLKTGERSESPANWKWDNFSLMQIVAVGPLLYCVTERGIDRYDIETFTSNLVLDIQEIRRTARRSGCGCCHRRC